jgi:hypothetical protein
MEMCILASRANKKTHTIKQFSIVLSCGHVKQVMDQEQNNED